MATVRMAAPKPAPGRKRAREETHSWGTLPEAILLRVFIKLSDAVDIVVAGEGTRGSSSHSLTKTASEQALACRLLLSALVEAN